MSELEGIRRDATEAWLAEHVADLPAPFEWTRLTGGTSNLTYRVRAANGHEVVVRRPPTGKLLPKAHDMGREYKIISGLDPTPVPVATPLAHCTDSDVTGAPFYVMAFCEGFTVRDTAARLAPLAPEARQRCGESVIESLVALHALDPADVGLADLGRPDAYVARQLNRWMDSWNKSHEVAQIELPALQKCFDALSSQIPEQGPARVVHGDYGPHNMLVSAAGDLVAVTDWEISTLGDPLADIAYLTNAWTDQSQEELPYEECRLAEGFAPRKELIARYEKLSGRSLEQLPFYVAFNYFKNACIVQGVYARFKGGVRSTQGIDPETFRSRVIGVVRAAERALEDLASAG